MRDDIGDKVKCIVDAFIWANAVIFGTKGCAIDRIGNRVRSPDGGAP